MTNRRSRIIYKLLIELSTISRIYLLKKIIQLFFLNNLTSKIAMGIGNDFAHQFFNAAEPALASRIAHPEMEEELDIAPRTSQGRVNEAERKYAITGQSRYHAK